MYLFSNFQMGCKGTKKNQNVLIMRQKLWFFAKILPQKVAKYRKQRSQNNFILKNEHTNF